MTASGNLNRRRPPTRLLVVIGLGIAIVSCAVVWWFLIRDDSPAAFDIDDATSGLVDDTDGASTDDDDANDTDGSPTTLDSADGTWAVDPTAGAAAGSTAAGFRVDEELSTVGNTTAVGRTTGVEATVVIADDVVTAADIVVDMTTLATDESRRDGRMHSALDTEQFPTATFSLAAPVALPSAPLDGETIQVTVPGELTIKGVTNPVEVTVDARIVDSTLVVVGSMPIVFSDYDVETPTAAIVLSVADEGMVEFQLFLAKS